LSKPEHRYAELLLAGALLVSACAGARATARAESAKAAPRAPEASCPSSPTAVAQARWVIDEYCVSCHSPSGAAGEDYDFRTDAAITARRRNIEAKLRLHLMPPPNARQPSEAERKSLWCWAKN
jgi:uncharacterized membrane protein